MKATGLNLRHLYYFWVVAKEGSVTRAAERLDVAIQTISAQLGLLDQAVGCVLLAPQGRRLVLTDAGRIALGYAEQIFALAEQMQDALAHADTAQVMRLTVGISDSLPKLIASRLLEAALQLPQQVKLVCFEDRFESLLGSLSVHKLDVVLTDRPVPPGTNLKVFSHLLGESEITLFGVPALAKKYPTIINAIRGRGLLLAFDLPNREMRDQFWKGAYELGLLVVRCGEKSIRLRPVLDVKDEVIEEALRLMDGECRRLM